MTRWLTADLHLGHARIGELAGRPHADALAGDRLLAMRWSMRVAPQDEVYILGDLAMGPFQASLDLVASLPGRKYLVPGNHDRVHPAYRASSSQRARYLGMYQEAGLDVLDLEVSLELAPGIHVRASHFPYEGDSRDQDRHLEYRPQDMGGWLVHGHVHTAWKVRGRQVNVGVDVWDYSPVSFDEIMSLITEEEGTT